jgi:hypothetical protein
MDPDRAKLAACTLRLLLTSSTALGRRVVTVHAVAFVNPHVVQRLACGAEIVVLLRHIGELLDPV